MPAPDANERGVVSSVLAQVVPVMLMDGDGSLVGALLAVTALAPHELLERLYDSAEAWLATSAGAPLRAFALDAALGAPARELRLGLLEVLSEMASKAELDLGPGVVAACLLLDPASVAQWRLDEDEGVRVLFSADSRGDG